MIRVTLLSQFFSQLMSYKDNMSSSDGANLVRHSYKAAAPLPFKPVLDWGKVTHVCWEWFSQPAGLSASQSVPCGPIISAQKPLLFYWVVATHNKSLPRTSEMEGGIPVTWGCVCVCVCVCVFPLRCLCFICFLLLFVPAASLQSHSPFIYRRCSLGQKVVCVFMTEEPGGACVCIQRTELGTTQAPMREEMKRREPKKWKEYSKSSRTTNSIPLNPLNPWLSSRLCKHRIKMFCVCVCLQPGPRAWWWARCRGAHAGRPPQASRRGRWRLVGWRSSAASWRTGSSAGLCCAQTSSSSTKTRKKPNHR